VGAKVDRIGKGAKPGSRRTSMSEVGGILHLSRRESAGFTT
jgi:hypothetical protein